MDIEELIRGLYEAHPDGFVAGRAAAIADAKRAGDRETAKRLTALRKPTVAAWLVNLLALRRPELIDELVELSTALRQAQRGLRGDELRELSTQRRQVVSALVNAAQRVAIEEDPALRSAKLPMAEVESTLTAALAEPEIAGQVRSGRLVRAATYAGFGEVPRPRLRLVTDSFSAATMPDQDDSEAGPVVLESDSGVSGAGSGVSGSGSGVSGSGSGVSGSGSGVSGSGSGVLGGEQRAEARRLREAEKARAARAERRRALSRELTVARTAEKKARSTLEHAEAAERDAGHAVDEIEEQIAEWERRRIVAQAEVSRRKLARRSAEREASVTRRRVGDVEAAIEDLDADEANH